VPPRSGELYSIFDLRFSLHMPDLLLALRSLARTPAFTVVVVLVLALGIGANTAIFSVVDAALLKPMPIPNADRVVRLAASHPQSFVWFNPRGIEVWPAFKHTKSFDAVGAYLTGELNLLGARGGRVRAAAVTPELFDVLGVSPILGRAFTEGDVTAGSFHLAVIGHELWQTRLEGARDVLGRQIVLSDQSFVVIGVMPRGFELPERTELWVPTRWASFVAPSRGPFPVVAARLARGVTAREAYQEILQTPLPMSGGKYTESSAVVITPLRDTLVGDMRAILLLLAAGALIVLLVASTNIASLLLTRVSARQREFAVRRALGASERDIARQILMETLVLSMLAFAATLPIAMWTLDAIRAWVPVRMYGAGNIAIDARTVAASSVFSLLTAALFGAAPLWSARGRSAVDALRSAAAATADPRWRKFRSGLAVAEIAFALVLLAGAVTAVRTVASLMSVDLGVRADRVLVIGVDWPVDQAQADRRLPFLQRYEEAFRALPGVEAVGVTTGVPGSMPQRRYAELIIDGLDVPEKGGYLGSHVMASPDYFSIMGVDLLAGRVFTARDHFYAPKVAVISETFARRYGLRPEEAVGRRAVLDHRWVDIVGVVRDIRPGGPGGMLDATAYIPFAQRQAGGPIQFVVKSHGDPVQLMAAARAAGAQVDPNTPLYDIRTFDQIREAHVRDRRFVMTMLSWFGGLAFVLAVLGLYAVISYLVHLRTREIGIRMAMGATTSSVRMSVLANGVAHCLAGIVLGGTLAVGLSQLLSSRLRDLGRLDLTTLSIVSAGFLASAALAAWLPARRATLIDPVQALRFE
jgi:putative ABC transport system permease protein